MFLYFINCSRKHGCISKRAVERSLSTNLAPEKRLIPGYHNIRNLKNGFPHDIVTLDPIMFSEKKQQCLHIGDLHTFSPCISLLKQSTPVTIKNIAYDRSVQWNGIYPAYPPNTKGFLYYSIPPEKPRIAGELRFRVTSTQDAASFESGSDLLLPDGRIWSRSLYSLSKYYFPLYEKLREERFIPDDLHMALATLPSKKWHFRRIHVLYTTKDTFVVDFSRSMTLASITEQGLGSLQFFIYNCSLYFKPPYTGSALARFERSTLPDHKGTRTIVLRFLKMITPVKCVIPRYDGYVCYPKEGDLFRKFTLQGRQKVWGVDIDKRKGSNVQVFKLLWDADK